ncbi:MAG: RNA polymerase sigma factor [Pseudonocardiaceae bacterium]
MIQVHARVSVPAEICPGGGVSLPTCQPRAAVSGRGEATGLRTRPAAGTTVEAGDATAGPGSRTIVGGAVGRGGDGGGVSGWELVAAAQAGDREAFGRLYGRYSGVVFGVVLARVGNWSLAEDVTSETFLRAWRGIASVRDQGRDVGAWLVGIAGNLVRDHVRSSRVRGEVLCAGVADYPVGERGPERVVLDRETAAQLARWVAGLGRAQRQCVVLRFWQGLSVAQTAVVMGRSEAAVKLLRYRALRRLRQQAGVA